MAGKEYLVHLAVVAFIGEALALRVIIVVDTFSVP